MEFGFSTLAQSALAYAAATSVELALLLGIFLMVLVFGFTYGKYRLAALIISAYTALALFLLFPYVDLIPWSPGLLFGKLSILPTVVFLIFVGLVYFALLPFIDAEYSRRQMRKWLEAGVLSLSVVVIFTASIYYAGITQNATAPQSLLDFLFLPPQYLFWWLLVPLIGLFIARD